MRLISGLADFCTFLCNYQPRITILFVLSVLGTLLTIPSLLYVESNSATFAVVVLNLMALIPVVILSGILTWWCSQTEQPN